MMFVPIKGEKHCSRCHEYKLLSQFSPRSDKPDGRHPYCKACRNKQAKERAALGRRKDRQHRVELWPRRFREALLDVRLRKWGGPVEVGNFAPNLGMTLPVMGREAAA